MAQNVMKQLQNDTNKMYHDKYIKWLTKTGYNWGVEDADDDDYD